MDPPAADLSRRAELEARARREERTETVDLDPRSAIGVVAAAAIVLALGGIARSTPEMVTRVVVGALVGVALTPVASAIERRWELSRQRAAALVGLGLALGVAAVLFLVGPPAVRQLQDFGDEVPQTIEELYSWPLIGAPLEEADAAAEAERWIDELPSRIDDQTIADLAERLLGGLVTAGIVVVTALGVLFDGPSAVRRIRAAIPAARREAADRTGRIVYRTFGSYFAGSLLVATLAGTVVMTVGLLLGVPLAPIAGLWVMLTNLIPQIGGFLGGAFFVLLALTESPLTAAIAAVVFLGYQQFENNVIGPAVVGTAVNLSPPVTMLAALVGGAAAGVPGALVATPLLGAAKALVQAQRGVIVEVRPSALRRFRLRRKGDGHSGRR